jgi:thioredoxin reductase
MQFWRDHMPEGMFLRSHWWAMSIAHPQNDYSIQKFFQQSSKYRSSFPLPRENFVEYCLWYQRNVVPDVDETYVEQVERVGESFVVTLADGRVLHALAVIIAVGMSPYANIPAPYQQLSPERVSHTSTRNNNLPRFKGQRVAVIGGGQSGVEAAALIHEHGAENVHLFVRRTINWLGPDTDEDQRPLWERIKAPRTGISADWVSWGVVNFPYLLYRFSQERKDKFIAGYYNTAAAYWLRERIFGKVDVREKQDVQSMHEENGEIVLQTTAGDTLRVDHILLATGYRVDMQRLHVLSSDLRSQIEVEPVQRTPLLKPNFESTNVPGLYFAGVSSLRSFGPMYRFVIGTGPTARRVTASIKRHIRARRLRNT